MITTYLGVDLSDVLGLDNMTEEERNNLLQEMEQLLFERILSRVWVMIDEDQQKSLEEASEDKIISLLNEYVPGFEMMALEEAAQFKKEIIDMQTEANRIIAENN